MSFERKSSHLAKLSAIGEAGSHDPACLYHGSIESTMKLRECGERLTRWLCSPGAQDEIGRMVHDVMCVAEGAPSQRSFTREDWVAEKNRTVKRILSALAQHALEERT